MEPHVLDKHPLHRWARMRSQRERLGPEVAIGALGQHGVRVFYGRTQAEADAKADRDRERKYGQWCGGEVDDG